MSKCSRPVSNLWLTSSLAFLVPAQTRIGAVAAIKLARDFFHVQDDLLVIGGDTLFLPDFNLRETLASFLTQYRSTSPSASMLLTYTTDDASTAKVGILEVNAEHKVRREFGFVRQALLSLLDIETDFFGEFSPANTQS